MKRTRFLLALLTGMLVLLPISMRPRSVIMASYPSGTTRVSVASGGLEAMEWHAYRGSHQSTISSDGRYVVFASFAVNLVPNDTNGDGPIEISLEKGRDVFVHDRQTLVTTRVSVASDGTQSNGPSQSPSISYNGRFVVFASEASNLVPGDTNNAQDVFVHDRETGATTRVSISSSGAQGNYQSGEPSISADGRFVAFYSDAYTLVADDTNGRPDVFVHDRQTAQTSRVSVRDNGEEDTGWPSAPEISGDGHLVAFESSSSTLIPGDTNLKNDVFVKDRLTGSLTRVSISSSGIQGNGDSRVWSVSANGQYVLFSSYADNLVPLDTNSDSDVFVRDLLNGTTSLVSVATDETQGNRGSMGGSISSDGRYVAFFSYADNLELGDSNADGDVFVRDLQQGTTSLVSISSGGAQANALSIGASISGDGRYVAFDSEASNLVSGDHNDTSDVFVYDRYSEPSFGAFAPTIGAVGQSVIITGRMLGATTGVTFNGVPASSFHVLSEREIMVVVPENASSGKLAVMLPGGTSVTSDTDFTVVLPPSIDSFSPTSGPPGTEVTITGNNLLYATRVEFDGNFAYDFSVVSDTAITAIAPTWLTSGSIALTTPGGTSATGTDFTATRFHDPSFCDPCRLPLVGETLAISDDGRYIAVEGVIYDIETDEQRSTPLHYIHDFSESGRYAVGDKLVGGTRTAYVYDRQNDNISLVAVASSGTPGNGNSSDGSISDDGRYIAFSSVSSNLVPLDNNGKYDVFVHDRETGTTTRVSVSSGGLQGNGDSSSATISADGRYVGFLSYASNLVPGDNNGTPDVFIHELVTHRTIRVSLPALGFYHTDHYSGYDDLSFSADLRYITFSSTADDLTPQDSNRAKDVFLFDRQNGETTVVSSADNGSLANRGSGFPTLSADGRYVMFASAASNLVPADTNKRGDTFVLDRLAGTLRLISTAADGIQGVDDSGSGVLSADGRFHAFRTFASNLDPDSPYQDGRIYLYAWRLEPAISGFTPLAAPAGRSVLINGTGLGEASVVDFNGTPASFTILSDRQLRAVVPDGVTDGKISVTARGSRLISIEDFTLIRPAVIASLTPPSGPARSIVTINGVNLAHTSAVAFNGVAATNFDVRSDSEISVVVPPQASTGRISITTPAGTSFSSTDFTVEPCSNPCRILVGFDGQAVDGASRRPYISPDGRFVSFSSLATNLVPGDVNDREDAFIHDLLTGETSIVSVTSGGSQFSVMANAGPFSADGRYVVFQTYPRTEWYTYIRDRETGTTTDLQAAVETQSELYAISLSGDGRYVVFGSAATDLVSNDTNGVSDIFVYDLQTDVTRRVSVASDGSQASSYSFRASISADGRFVVFSSYASNLVPGDTNEMPDVFVHDLEHGITTRVSVATGGSQASGNDSDIPYLSADGRYVVFSSYSDVIDPGDTNESGDIYVHDRQTGQTSLVSKSADGTAGRETSYRPSISGDGRYVAFYSHARLVPDDTDDRLDIYVYDRQDGTMRRFLTNVNDEYISMSADGRHFAFSALFGEVEPVNLPPLAGDSSATLAADDATTSSLVAGTNEVEDIFVYRRAGRTAILGFAPYFGLAGTPVTIFGKDFFDVSAVTFGAVAAPFTVETSGRINATVPPGAVTNRITVTTSNGTATSGTSFAVAPSPAPAVYLSPTGTGTIAGRAFTGADILSYVASTGAWDVFYDGSYVKTAKNIGAFTFQGNDMILGFTSAQVVPGFGVAAAPQDLVRFTPTRTGYNNTAGSFAWFFDGSDVGLTTSGEIVDAIWIDAIGRLYISTTGAGIVPVNSAMPTGAQFRFQDEDIVRFTPAAGSTGATTAGTWELYWDPSGIAGMLAEDINGYWEDPVTGDRYVTILGPFTVGNTAYGAKLTGDGKSVLRFVRSTSAPGGWAPAEKVAWLAPGGTLPRTFAIDGIEMGR